jgi:hypothetical protein
VTGGISYRGGQESAVKYFKQNLHEDGLCKNCLDNSVLKLVER